MCVVAVKHESVLKQNPFWVDDFEDGSVRVFLCVCVCMIMNFMIIIMIMIIFYGYDICTYITQNTCVQKNYII